MSVHPKETASAAAIVPEGKSTRTRLARRKCRFRGDEEKQASDDALQGWLEQIRSGLQNDEPGAATEYARTVLRPELRARGSSADTILISFLTGIYATWWVVRKMEDAAQRKLMRAVGLREDTQKPFLDLINRSWPPPTDRGKRKTVQTRHSRYHRALEAALARGIRPPDLPAAFREYGGVDGWAKAASLDRRKADRKSKADGGVRSSAGMGTKAPREGTTASLKGSGRRGEGVKPRGFGDLNPTDGVPHGRDRGAGRGSRPNQPVVAFGRRPRAHLLRRRPLLAILHPEGPINQDEWCIDNVLPLADHKRDQDEHLLDEIARYLMK